MPLSFSPSRICSWACVTRMNCRPALRGDRNHEGIHDVSENIEGGPSGKAVRRARTWAESKKLNESSAFKGPNDSASPSPAIAAALEAIQDVDRLETLSARILEPDLHGWDDLLRGS